MGKEGPPKEGWFIRGGYCSVPRYPRQDVNEYDIRAPLREAVYHGGWFSPNWFPGDFWWGEGEVT